MTEIGTETETLVRSLSGLSEKCGGTIKTLDAQYTDIVGKIAYIRGEIDAGRPYPHLAVAYIDNAVANAMMNIGIIGGHVSQMQRQVMDLRGKDGRPAFHVDGAPTQEPIAETRAATMGEENKE